MSRQWIITRLRFFLFFIFIKNATSVCTITSSSDILRVNSNVGPLIYKYKQDGTPEFHLYSSTNTNCIFQSEERKLHLTCPGSNNTMQFYQVVGNTTQVVNATSGSVYLLHDPLNVNSVVVHGGPSSFKIIPGNYVQCLESRSPTMHLLNGTESPSLETYAVGYRLNDIDLLKVYEQVHTPGGWVVSRFRMKSFIESRPKLGEYIREYEKGLSYQNIRINLTEIYSRQYQIASFQDYFQSLDLTEKYFGGDNLLVIGQLIFQQDMFYHAEQVSAFFCENTAPIWKSIYEGNWKSIGAIIRKLADVRDRDLNVFVTAMPSFLVNSVSNDWVLGNTTNSPDYIPVPQILVKVAVDVEDYTRGIVFHTFNDPHLIPSTVPSKVRGFCSKSMDCQKLHPEFEDFYKGYTFCCTPENSIVFKTLFNLK